MDTQEALNRGETAIDLIAKRPGGYGDLILVTRLIDPEHSRTGPGGVLICFALTLRNSRSKRTARDPGSENWPGSGGKG